jgi:hypothetical protein
VARPEEAREFVLERFDVRALNELSACTAVLDDLSEFGYDAGAKP